jgi:hypothetical protein
MHDENNPSVSPREIWRPDHRAIGFDIGIAAEDIMEAAGLRVYCDNDPFRIDCMRAVLRRLKAHDQAPGRLPYHPRTSRSRPTPPTIG